MRKSVYKSSKGEKIVLEIYDKQVLALNIEFEDIYPMTTSRKAITADTSLEGP